MTGKTITGTPGTDSLIGTTGDDTIHPGGGSDYIDGGAGTDRVRLPGKFTTWRVSQNADGSFGIYDRAASDTDYAKNVEIIEFDDIEIRIKGAGDASAPPPAPTLPAELTVNGVAYVRKAGGGGE